MTVLGDEISIDVDSYVPQRRQEAALEETAPSRLSHSSRSMSDEQATASLQEQVAKLVGEVEMLKLRLNAAENDIPRQSGNVRWADEHAESEQDILIPPQIQDASSRDAALTDTALQESSDDWRSKYENDLHQSRFEKHEWHKPFRESTYTFIYMCSPNDLAFWYAIFVYALQISLCILTILDIMDWKRKDNRLQIPPMVDLTVTIAQAATVLITVAFQQDLIEAVCKLHEGHYPEVLETHPGATFKTWLISCLAQLLAGILLLSATFVLTMQVEDVITIMTNFAGLTFIAEIDDLAFALSKMGFINRSIRQRAEEVEHFRVPKRQTNRRVRQALYFGSLTMLIVLYSVIKIQQINGKYLQTYVFVQFGDAWNPKLPYYSGLLKSHDTTTSYRRSYRDVATNEFLLAYCQSETAWTFSETNDACDFFAKSPETRTFDVTTISNSEWQVKDSLGRFQPFDSFSLVGRDCDEEACGGKCVDGLCQCPTHLFGLDCQFGDVCPEVVIDGNLGKFPGFQGFLDVIVEGVIFSVGEYFRVLKNATGAHVKVYDMPVYYSDENFPATFIFFSGRRWVLTHQLYPFEEEFRKGFDDNADHEIEELWQDLFSLQPLIENATSVYLQHPEFHAHYNAQYEPMFLSDPVDFQTPNFQPAGCYRDLDGGMGQRQCTRNSSSELSLLASIPRHRVNHFACFSAF